MVRRLPPNQKTWVRFLPPLPIQEINARSFSCTHTYFNTLSVGGKWMKVLLLIISMLTQEYNCISENVYYEARNQPFIGQVAVADVTLNRVKEDKWPGTPCAVVKQRKQFSWTMAPVPRPTGEAWVTAHKAVAVSLVSPDRTQGATFFHATYVQPYWVEEVNFVTQIGDHKFYAR